MALLSDATLGTVDLARRLTRCLLERLQSPGHRELFVFMLQIQILKKEVAVGMLGTDCAHAARTAGVRPGVRLHCLAKVGPYSKGLSPIPKNKERGQGRP